MTVKCPVCQVQWESVSEVGTTCWCCDGYVGVKLKPDVIGTWPFADNALVTYRPPLPTTMPGWVFGAARAAGYASHG